ncbi:uncharacterized protein EV420DRAFT_1645858 [Desarmillaria tabescens]|uniref:Uncharacterized protein n=1 Tax=Armillaria tabescens TaxID=1929756 RepID=A0AA39MZ37_ARMTA|nr:uncharacterized protein EV420DRAFT_1645858 [Desarmillaria tabescens]KAK0451952.1 hypothetical protein EV420DRAFT_1645858 [Desarmillaria tabescens]
MAFRYVHLLPQSYWHDPNSWHARYSILQTSGAIPNILKKCSDAINRLVSGQSRETAFSVLDTGIQVSRKAPLESLNQQMFRAPPEVIEAFQRSPLFRGVLQSTVRKVSYYRFKETTYSISSRHRGNSQVFIDVSRGKGKGKDGDCAISSEIPVVIRYILQPNPDDLSQVYLAVCHLQSVSVDSDPFTEFDILGGRLWSRNLADKLEIIDARAVNKHFVRCDVMWEDQPVSAVLPLSRILALIPKHEPEPDNVSHLLDQSARLSAETVEGSSLDVLDLDGQ